MEKETWIVPCGYTGTLTVYFNSKVAQHSENRIYKFNNKGVYYTNLNSNEGFTTDFNQTLNILIDCNGHYQKISFFDNDNPDTSKLISGQKYATYFLTGKDGLFNESLSILTKK
ncbi:hypothetical protein SAMN05216490_0145 [Mucilaginibacter mallensis]|uniref:DUF6843 domain-containing protein n=2 Tax=Mucilaginibacter mallensis TaxID=652787 RepID=A0A1H1MRM6_MUCMA|nr:hypothetical protein SAMN05216490_0145 [Mucilaginibacter mallensis]